MSPDGIAPIGNLTAPDRDIHGGHVTHEYLPAQQMQTFLDTLKQYVDDGIFQQATLGYAGVNQWEAAFNNALERTSSFYTPAQLSAPYLRQWAKSMAYWGRHNVDQFSRILHQASDIQNTLSAEFNDEVNRLTLKKLYESGQTKKVLEHYSNSLGLVNHLINQNGSFFTFADPQHSSKMRKLDTSNESNDLNPRAWFPKGQKEDWPLLTLMSNTSAARDLDDIAVVAHGFEKLYFEANDGAPERPIKVISTLHTEENSLANGSVIAQRIENIQKDHAAGDGSHIDEVDYHIHRRNLEGITPDVVRLGNLFLSCLLEDPKQIDVTCTSMQQPLEHKGDLPPIRSDAKNDAPLLLREDYLDVARHIRFAGYSRGGNVATDAWRYVARQLVGNGKTGGIQPSRFHKADNSELTEDDAKAVLDATGVLSVAAWESPASEVERGLGLNRVSLANDKDHLIHEWIRANGDYEAFKDDDQLYVVRGVMGNIAHAPREAMIGDGKKTGYFADTANKILNPCQRFQCAMSIPAALHDFFSVRAHSKEYPTTTHADASEIVDSVIEADSASLESRITQNSVAPAL